MIISVSDSKEGNLKKHVSNFPLLFDRIGYVLDKLKRLQTTRRGLSSAKLAAEFDKMCKGSSPSEIDAAYDAWEEIVDTTYYDRASRGCLGGSTKMR